MIKNPIVLMAYAICRFIRQNLCSCYLQWYTYVPLFIPHFPYLFPHLVTDIESFVLVLTGHNLHVQSYIIPLIILFNNSINYGYFRVFWKDPYILYRFLILVLSPMLHHTLSLLSPHQHGFRKGCSTTTNILQLISTINETFSERKQTDIIFTDFSKAFDKLNHKLL